MNKKMKERQNSRPSVGALPEFKKNAGGRPPKYSEASKPITVTLPERILQDLHSMNPDRSRAIVKCVEALKAKGDSSFKPVELIKIGPGKALILVGQSSSLRQIKWLRLIEIAPFRYLLALPPRTAIESLEVTIQDIFRDLDPNSSENLLLQQLLDVISHRRRVKSISKVELLLVDVRSQGSMNSRWL
jgi:hypothetical protein